MHWIGLDFRRVAQRKQNSCLIVLPWKLDEKSRHDRTVAACTRSLNTECDRARPAFRDVDVSTGGNKSKQHLQKYAERNVKEIHCPREMSKLRRPFWSSVKVGTHPRRSASWMTCDKSGHRSTIDDATAELVRHGMSWFTILMTANRNLMAIISVAERLAFSWCVSKTPTIVDHSPLRPSLFCTMRVA